MTNRRLDELAEAAGLSPRWRDTFGEIQQVSPDTLRAALAALDLPAANEAQIADSLARLRHQREMRLPPLVTAEADAAVSLAAAPGRFRLLLEDGGVIEGFAEEQASRAVLPAIGQPGYHRLLLGGQETTVAVAPPRCFGISDIAPGQKLWGLAVQLYSLRRPGDGGIGDFAALRQFVPEAAARGAACVAISPVHAQFSADPDRFSPYAPSSRVALNAAHADADAFLSEPLDEPMRALEGRALIDWPAATRARLHRLRRAFDAAMRDPQAREALDAFRAREGELLERHARFEALHAHFFGADPAKWNWRSWPEPYRDPASAAVADFAREHAEAVAFHAFLQFLAASGLGAAQNAARAAGMPVGIIADLAVGTDSGGSHCWSRQEETLLGLAIGAPPDRLSLEGQNWGLTAFSPRGLRSHGFGGFLEMLRASLRHAGGVRIDHVMGLMRLWVIPDGAHATEGVYLRMPFDDLLRLVRLESRRRRAIILGEDLGTVPEGFQARLRDAGVMGLRVLWFEREQDGHFRPPRDWSPDAVAMTSTHDLATVAGWWSGRDIEWRERLGLLRDPAAAHAERTRDRALLWDAFRQSGAARDAAPPPEQPDHAAGSACVHIGHAACALAVLPMEDALALREQPNLPGTLHEHPNWQRRLPGEAARLLDHPMVAGRLAALARARRGE